VGANFARGSRDMERRPAPLATGNRRSCDRSAHGLVTNPSARPASCRRGHAPRIVFRSSQTFSSKKFPSSQHGAIGFKRQTRSLPKRADLIQGNRDHWFANPVRDRGLRESQQQAQVIKLFGFCCLRIRPLAGTYGIPYVRSHCGKT